MKFFLFIFMLIISSNNFAAQARIENNSTSKNVDSLKWEKENINWEKNLFLEPDLVNRLTVNKVTGEMNLYTSMTQECRIFGYQKPSEYSAKLLLLSIWTFDVSGNPSESKYGSFYSTEDMDGITLKFVSRSSNFIKASIIKNGDAIDSVYFKAKWIRFQ